MGFSHQNVTLVLVTLQVGFIVLAVGLSTHMGVNALLGIVVAGSFLVFPTLSLKRKLLSNTPLPGIIEKNGGARLQEKNSFDSKEKASNGQGATEKDKNQDGSQPGKPEWVSEPEMEESVRM